ncbi:hypothetical protein [Mesorhizobium sp. CAU 1741]|uniref:hypothetical protein n=1 Tax=Mesorhizobium sp. CAU 1741 TaxID=3140366 RepID=UPI00325A59A0
MTTKHEVIAAHQAHPEWCASDIAAALGCMREYVVATAKRNRLVLPPKKQPSRVVYLGKAVADLLREAADIREMTPNELAQAIIETVARENMVDAILDDREAA